MADPVEPAPPILALAWSYSSELWADDFVEWLVAEWGELSYFARDLAFQASLRVRKGQPLPPKLQTWFNAYVIAGGIIPARQPRRRAKDKIAFAAAQKFLGMIKAEAIREIAAKRGADPRAVEQNVYRRS